MKRFLSCVSHQCHRHEATNGRTDADDAWTTTHDASPPSHDDAGQTRNGSPRQIRLRGGFVVINRFCPVKTLGFFLNSAVNLEHKSFLIMTFLIFFFFAPSGIYTIHIWNSFRFFKQLLNFLKQHPQFLVSLRFTVQSTYSTNMFDLMVFSRFLLCCWFKMFLYIICIGLGNKTML